MLLSWESSFTEAGRIIKGLKLEVHECLSLDRGIELRPSKLSRLEPSPQTQI